MRRLRITILDLVTKGPSRKTFARVMHPNMASIMPQVIGVWCEELGHTVRYICYTGFEDLSKELVGDTDLLFVGAFSRAGQTAYAVSNLFRSRGAITVLGGPHARCYPQDAVKYFDYVLGLTDKALIEEVVRDCAPHRPMGLQLHAERQPLLLPGVKERWKFIEPTIAKAPALKVIPMIGSMGCPYTCSFCIDSVIDYQPLAFDQIREDLVFLQGKLRKPWVGWHDPIFGVRFNDYMSVIDDVVPPGKIHFIAESSLSLLSEPHLQHLQRNGFKAILPGIESWFSNGDKSKTGPKEGLEKVRQVSDHINMILRYIPYVQTNFILGLDSDEGPEPFELTKRFLDLSPGAYPTFSLFTAFGQAAPINMELQRAGRVLPIPFHFLDNKRAMNIRPKHYAWSEFYDHVLGLTEYALSWPRIMRRFQANRGLGTKLLNAVRAAPASRLKWDKKIRYLLDSDSTVRNFFEGETNVLPQIYENRIRKNLGPLWPALPIGALIHDQNAYLNSASSSDWADTSMPPPLIRPATAVT